MQQQSAYSKQHKTKIFEEKKNKALNEWKYRKSIWKEMVDPPDKRSRGVLIIENSYAKHKTLKIGFVVKNKFAQLSGKYKQQDIRLIYNIKAESNNTSKQQIINKLKQFFEQPYHFLVLYFIGHGNNYQKQQKTIRIFENDDDKNVFLDIRQVLQLWRPKALKHLIIFLEVCYMGEAVSILHKQYGYLDTVSIVTASKDKKHFIYPFKFGYESPLQKDLFDGMKYTNSRAFAQQYYPQDVQRCMHQIKRQQNDGFHDCGMKDCNCPEKQVQFNTKYDPQGHFGHPEWIQDFTALYAKIYEKRRMEVITENSLNFNIYDEQKFLQDVARLRQQIRQRLPEKGEHVKNSKDDKPINYIFGDLQKLKSGENVKGVLWFANQLKELLYEGFMYFNKQSQSYVFNGYGRLHYIIDTTNVLKRYQFFGNFNQGKLEGQCYIEDSYIDSSSKKINDNKKITTVGGSNKPMQSEDQNHQQMEMVQQYHLECEQHITQKTKKSYHKIPYHQRNVSIFSGYIEKTQQNQNQKDAWKSKQTFTLKQEQGKKYIIPNCSFRHNKSYRQGNGNIYQFYKQYKYFEDCLKQSKSDSILTIQKSINKVDVYYGKPETKSGQSFFKNFHNGRILDHFGHFFDREKNETYTFQKKIHRNEEKIIIPINYYISNENYPSNLHQTRQNTDNKLITKISGQNND